MLYVKKYFELLRIKEVILKFYELLSYFGNAAFLCQLTSFPKQGNWSLACAFFESGKNPH